MDKNSLAGLVALTLIAAIVAVLAYCGKVSETSFLMVVSAIMGGVLQRYFPARVSNGNSVPPVGPAVGIVLAALGLHGCGSTTQSHDTTSTVVKTVEVSTDACKAIADLHGRSDIATGCEITGGVVSILDKLLSEVEQAKEAQPQAVSHDVCVSTRTSDPIDAGLLDSRK